LELSLLFFQTTFKTHCFGDPRILLIGQQHLNNKEEEDDDLDTFQKIDSDAQKSYNAIAQMMDFTDMLQIMGIFAEKILQNLVYASSEKEEDKRLVDVTLDVFDIFVYTSSSSKMLCRLEIIQKLIKHHVVQFNILQNDNNLKHLSTFYKILTTLWLNEEYVHDFSQYISQLNSLIQELFSLDDVQLK